MLIQLAGDGKCSPSPLALLQRCSRNAKPNGADSPFRRRIISSLRFYQKKWNKSKTHLLENSPPESRLPVNVSLSENSIMSSCVKPLVQSKQNPVVLLHGFDRYTFPLLEETGLEILAVVILDSAGPDILKLWKSYIKRPITLVGPSLGAALAVGFAVNHPEAVENLVLIDASVYAEGTGNLAKLPRAAAYAGIGSLHCLYPWWKDATVNFMISGGYNVSGQINQVKQKTLIIWGEDDQIISNKIAVILYCELPDTIIRQIPNCGHLPQEKPDSVATLILEFMQDYCQKKAQVVHM